MPSTPSVSRIVFFDRRQINVRGRAFEQNVDRFADQIPRAENDNQAYQNAARGIRPEPAESENQNAGDNRRHRAERVADDVQPRAAHIQIVLVVAVQEISADEID